MTPSSNEGPPPGPAQTATLVGFRAELHNCLFAWADALFELCDAVLCAPAPVASVPSLSLEPVFRRSHGSLYKALAHGSIDTDWLRRSLVAHRPAGWPPVFAVDASTWDRCDAETSPERGFHYSASKHSTASRSWPAGPISGSPSSTGRLTPGPPRSTRSASPRP